MTKYQVVVLRFAKGFIAGGLGTVAAVLAGGVSIHSVEELQKVLISLIVPFLTGGILAAEKYLNYVPNEVQTTEESTP